MSRTPGLVVKAGSGIGEDTRQVLTQDLGMTEAEVDQLVATKAIWCAGSPPGTSRVETALSAAA